MELRIDISGVVTEIDRSPDRTWARLEITHAISATQQRVFSILVATTQLTAAVGDEITAHVRAVNQSSHLTRGQLVIHALFLATSLTVNERSTQ